jgi:hypothetical protein
VIHVDAISPLRVILVLAVAVALISCDPARPRYAQPSSPTRTADSPVEFPAPAESPAPAASPAPSSSSSAPPTSTPVPVVQRATGEFTTAPGGEETPSAARVVRYTVAVEQGLPETPESFATEVQRILSDPRGWSRLDGVALQRVAGEAADLRVVLASPATVDALCAPLDTAGEVSCFANGRAVINQARWELGVPHFSTGLVAYREYLINHEVGHGLGHQHTPCPGPGLPAPVMLQQTYGLDGCLPNGWPTTTGG